jgi:NifU-like protein involved in Fe-S cluster formation
MNFANLRASVALRRGAIYRRAVPTALYNRDILRLAASIPHQKRLERPDASAEKRSPVCGSRVAVDIVLDRQGRVAALGQEVSACALGQASAALMGASAVGRSAAELAAARDALAAYLRGERGDPGSWPGLAIFADARPFAARHPSILLAFEAAAEAAARARGG